MWYPLPAEYVASFGSCSKHVSLTTVRNICLFSISDTNDGVIFPCSKISHTILAAVVSYAIMHVLSDVNMKMLRLAG